MNNRNTCNSCACPVRAVNHVYSLASARLCRGEARLARRIDIENNHNSCAPHTAGESGFAPTIDHWRARRGFYYGVPWRAATIAPGAHYFQLKTSNLSEARPITYLGIAAPPTSHPHCPFRGGVSNATDGTKQKNDPATTPHNSKKNGTAHLGASRK